MAVTKYTQNFNLENYLNISQGVALPQIQVELTEISRVTDDIIDALDAIQNDDLSLGNGSVHVDSFSVASLTLMGGSWVPTGAWATATIYAVSDVVTFSGSTYVCVVAHTSSVFSNDVILSRWIAIESTSADVVASFVGTSTTSLAIALGTKVFETQAGKSWKAGAYVIAVSDAASTDYMSGQVTSYSGTTLTVSVAVKGGSGTVADWTIDLSGAPGADGSPGGGDMTTSTYDPTNVAGDAFDMDQMVEGSTTKILTDTERTKLGLIEASATADQSNGEIKTAYEANSDTNAFTDANSSKLSGIETSATADQSNAEIKTAYEANADTNAFTDANSTKLGTIEDSATANSSDAALIARANHTGTQLLSTIYDSGTLAALDAVEGTAILSTGEAGGTKFLREDGDGTSSWQTPSGAGDVSAAAVMVDNSVVRGNGGAKGVQDSGVLVDDSNNVSGVNGMSVVLTIETGVGNASVPAYSFTAENTMGMYRNGTSDLAFSVDSTRVLSIVAEGVELRSNDLLDVGGIRFDGSPDTDATATGPQTNTHAAGYTTAVGDLVYLDGTSGRWEQADANAAGTTKGLLGIALEVKADGVACLVALPGSYVRADTPFAFTAGQELYVSETAAGITATAPTTSGALVRIVGWAVTADVIYLAGDPTYVTAS